MRRTTTGAESYGGLFHGAPPLFEVVMMNPSFGAARRNLRLQSALRPCESELRLRKGKFQFNDGRA